MLAAVHLADVDARTALRLLRRSVDPTSVPGMRSANAGLAAPLRTGSVPRVGLGRVGLVSFWDDDAALDAFEATHPVAAALAGGWSARLAPLRAFGTWPGLDASVPGARRVDYDGPALVLTLGRMRLTRTIAFLRASQKAEAAVADAPGKTWATGIARPPFVCTCSLWQDAASIAAYAFAAGAHSSAIELDRARPFHHQEAFIRFRPYRVGGALGGRNPLTFGLSDAPG
jgi:hypothetical protein